MDGRHLSIKSVVTNNEATEDERLSERVNAAQTDEAEESTESSELRAREAFKRTLVWKRRRRRRRRTDGRTAIPTGPSISNQSRAGDPVNNKDSEPERPRLASALFGPAVSLSLSDSSDWLLHRHKPRPSFLSQHPLPQSATWRRCRPLQAEARQSRPLSVTSSPRARDLFFPGGVRGREGGIDSARHDTAEKKKKRKASVCSTSPYLSLTSKGQQTRPC